MMGLLKRRARPVYRTGAFVRPAPGVSVAERDGRAVLLDLKGERYFGLDEVGADLWAALAGGGTALSAAESISGEYDVAPEVLLADAERFTADLVAARLLEVV